MEISFAMWILIAITVILCGFFLFLSLFIKWINEADDEFMREMADEASRSEKNNG